MTTSPSPFAAIETATAASAVAALANVSAVVNGRQVSGIFDNGFNDAIGIAGSSPMLDCISDEVDAVRGDTVTIGTTAYTVVTVQPDGTGMTRLILQES